ncbi:MAG: ATP-grasp domain-containing protein [Lentisphaerae bacterium]|nr:ATP-grasp domain-containing protein [Lentisphaerota bacterium]
MKKLEVLVVFDSAGTPPENQDFTEEFKTNAWFAESSVVKELRRMGHTVHTLGIYDDVSLLVDNLKDKPPDIVFNLTELFMGKAHLDKNIPALLELMNVRYTGCSAGSLELCNNKALSKKILMYHRIMVPRFFTFKKGKKISIPKKLRFPVIIKPLREEASTGISQASYATNESRFLERVQFIHDNMNMNAIAEEYIEGREIYVSVIGAQRLLAFPIRDMKFSKVPDGEPHIATYKAKWDEEYRKKWGISNGFADDLPNSVTKQIHRTCKRAYRALSIDGYARFDCRLTDTDKLYVIEANGNPDLAPDDEFAESAQRGGCSYDRLLARILNLGLEREDIIML